MLKFGVISEVDSAKGLARVFFEEDDFVSGWLKVGVPRSKGDQFSFPFQINEHVYCIMDEDWEYGVVAGAVYDEANLPDNAETGILRWSFVDGSVITYSTNDRTLTLDINGDINIKCNNAKIESAGNVDVEANSVSISAETTTITGNLMVNGAAEVTGVLSMGGLSGISGAAVDGGDSEIKVSILTASDDVKAGNVSLKTHKHTSAASGSPTTPPIP